MKEQDFNAVFSRNLKHYLDKKGISQNELSRLIGVSPTSINNWVRGLKSPRMDKVDKMCQLLNIRRSDLIEDKSDQQGQPPRPDTIYESDSFSIASPSRRLKDGAEDFIEAQLMALTRPTRSSMIEWLRDNYLGAASDGSDYEDFDDEKLEAFYNEIQILSRR